MRNLEPLGRRYRRATFVAADTRRSQLRVLLAIAVVLGVLSGGATSASAADTITWGTPKQVVSQAPFNARSEVSGISCPTENVCVAVSGFGVIRSAPGVAGPWTVRLADRNRQFTDVSCATATLCVAVTASGDLYRSATPTTSAWNLTTGVASTLTAISCASTTLCAAAGKNPIGGGVFVSTDPLNGGSWTGGSLRFNTGAPVDVACVVDTATYCMTISGTGGEMITTKAAPTGYSDWVTGQSVTEPISISCALSDVCVGIEADGDLSVMAFSPGVLAQKDRPLPADAGAQIECTSQTLCIEITAAGTARRSTNPFNGTSYATTTTHTAAMTAVACVKTTSACAIGTADGRIISTPDASASSPTWTTGPVLEQLNTLTDVDCFSATFCAAVDTNGHLSTSATPTAGLASWNTTQIDPAGRSATKVECPSTTLCLVAYPGGDIITVQNPLGARTATVRPVATYPVTSMSCPSASLCVLGTSRGTIVTSTNPASAAWTEAVIDADALALTCRTTTDCSAVTSSGKLHVSGDPAAGRSSWSYGGAIGGLPETFVGGSTYAQPATIALSCPAATSCLLGTDDGQIGTLDPTKFKPTWTKQTVAGLSTPTTRSKVSDIDCSTERVCVASLIDGKAVTWAPGPGIGLQPGVVTSSTAWSLQGVACAGAAFCLTADVTGQLTAGTVNHATLSVAKIGVGTGTVTGAGLAIDCGASCSALVPVGGVITLLAAPTAPASALASWTGQAGCSGTRLDCPVLVDGNVTVTAQFGPSQRTLRVRVFGGGYVTSDPAGLVCQDVCRAGADYGQVVTLKANPYENSQFSFWDLECAASETDTCQIKLDQFDGSVDREIEVRFTKIQHIVAFSTDGPGTMSEVPFGGCPTANCRGRMEQGSTFTVTARPAPNAEFSGWEGACTGTTPTCSVTVDSGKDIKAKFRPIQRILTVVKAGAGSGSVASKPTGISCGATCAAGYDHGQVVTLTATPEALSTFTGWVGACTGAAATCQVTMDGAQVVAATFTKAPDTGGDGTPGGAGNTPGGGSGTPGGGETPGGGGTPGASAPGGTDSPGGGGTPGASAPGGTDSPGGGGTPGASAPGGSTPAGPTPTNPVISGAALSAPSVVPGKVLQFSVTSAETGTVRIVISKATPGRKSAGVCKPQTKKNKKAKPCSFDKEVTTLTGPGAAGKVSIAFNGKAGKKKLAIGTYKATITITGPTGLVSKPTILTFKVKKK